LPYVAPEQAVGKPGAATTATDVYGLGAVLYACLTGRPPGRGETTAAVLECVLHGEPDRPRRVDPRVPRDLEAVCLRCLEREPGRRYATAAALADDLRRYLDGRPTRARPVGPTVRAVRWARRRPDLAALGTLAAVAVLALVIVGGWLSVRLAVSRAENEAARRVQEYFAVIDRARHRRSEPRVGWTGESLAELAGATQLPPAADRLPELRTEAAACLSAVDLRQVRTLSEDFPVYDLAYSPDGRLLAVSRYWPDGAIGKVRLIDPDDGRIIRELTYAADQAEAATSGKADGGRDLAFSPDGRWLVASSRSGWLHRWDLGTDTPRAVSWQAHHSRGKLYSPDLVFGVVRPLLFSRSPGAMQCWDPADGWKEVRRWEPDYVGAPAVDPVSGRVAFTNDYQMHLLDGRTLDRCRPPVIHDQFHLGCITASANGRIVAIASDKQLLHLADVDIGRVLR
jgi:hypothetical protein